MAKIFGQLENAQLENLGIDPTTSTAGRFYLNTVTGTVVVDDGTTKRSLLRNDGKAVFGTDATPANNVRFHHSGVGMLQFVPGNDTTAENVVSSTLAQVGFRATNLATAPAVGNPGRIYFNTATSGLQVDNGAAFLQFATLTGTETLTNKTFDVISTTDQATTPTTPAAGSTKFYSRAGSLYKLGTDGLETLVGAGGGSGGFNYLANGDFESGITTVQYASTTVTNGLPSGTGPTLSNTPNTITLTSEATSPLRRTKSLRATAASAWTIGQGFSVGPAFVVQPADLGKILNVSMNYQVVSGNTTLGYTGLPGGQSLAIAVYDVTSGAWLPAPPGSLGFNQGFGTGSVTATFQTSVTVGQQYQVFVLNLVPSSGPVTVLFDDIQVSPNVANSADTRPITFAGALSANQSIAGNTTNFAATTLNDRAGAWTGTTYVVPVAGDYFCSGSFSYSTATNGFFALNGTQYNGNFFSTAAAGGVSAGSVLLTGLQPGNVISLRNNNAGTASNVVIGISRIGGQSGNTNDAKVVAFHAQATGAIGANNQVLIFDSVLLDQGSGYNKATGVYTIPSTGIYRAGGGLIVNGASCFITLYKNGAPYERCGQSAATQFQACGSTLISCVAGDQLTLVGNGGTALAGNTFNYFTVDRLTGPSSVAASESFNTTYGLTSAFSAASGAPIKFDTRVVDSQAIYNPATGLATVNASGTYRLSCNINVSATGASLTNYALVNGVGAGILVYVSALNVGFSGSCTLRLQAGQTVGVAGNTTATYNATNATLGFANQFSLERTGN